METLAAAGRARAERREPGGLTDFTPVRHPGGCCLARLVVLVVVMLVILLMAPVFLSAFFGFG
jgi:hypothetical protein